MTYLFSGVGGLSVLKAIRAQPKFSALPVIMITGRADVNLVRELVAAGVSGYLVKPVSGAAIFVAMKA